jgi:hypothetical protein
LEGSHELWSSGNTKPLELETFGDRFLHRSGPRQDPIFYLMDRLPLHGTVYINEFFDSEEFRDPLSWMASTIGAHVIRLTHLARQPYRVPELGEQD